MDYTTFTIRVIINNTFSFAEENYLYFLAKIRKDLLYQIDIFAYCLMPNHFHFLVLTHSDFDIKLFRNKFRTILSSYAQAINKQQERSGALFRPNSKVQKS